MHMLTIRSHNPVFLSVKNKRKGSANSRELDLLWAGFTLEGYAATFWGPLKGQIMWTFAYNAYAQMNDRTQCALLVHELELLWYQQSTEAVSNKEAELLGVEDVQKKRTQRRVAMVASLQEMAQKPESSDDDERKAFWYTLITLTGYRGMAHGDFAKDGIGKLLVTPAGLAPVCAYFAMQIYTYQTY